ncbi:Octanoyltransferase LipM,Lipoate-protein ligase A,Biotin/lipoate A/B protein ligase family [Chlamydia poikilotherma]|uniref:Octanoyltransferase LipM,Lipoate-protein ligase A,Biotin/lipoate A/B protein ligase family n=1 Tax=Chlamydia poikilotherma TaxID=1967783 RepID=A0A3B0PP35_9CHLA|nr:Octanoyltransferase LipM,Lipoate-protein ligase A,Biotin/lipoate A/B protein ligase family [Chlamydia poikilotherma]
MTVRIVDSGKGSSEAHMARDKYLLEHLKRGEAILHLYEWGSQYPLTYGYFMRPEKFLIDNRADLGMDAAIRPTGGGFVFHHGDYAFSLLMSSEHPMYAPTVLENYYTVNQVVLQVLNKVFRIKGTLSFDEDTHHPQTSNFCMAKASKYDVLMGDKKVGGAAQRTVKQGFLHQGSIFLSGSSLEFYRKFLLPEVIDVIVPAIEKRAFFPLGLSAPSSDLSEARKEIKEGLIQRFSSGHL